MLMKLHKTVNTTVFKEKIIQINGGVLMIIIFPQQASLEKRKLDIYLLCSNFNIFQNFN